MKLDSLEKLYIHELKDLYSAENQILKALPKMEKAASSKALKKAFKEHRAETKKHISRLEKVFGGLDARPGGERCQGAAGLIKEANGLIKADVTPEVLDAALVSAAQRIEHYEMAGYGTSVALAKKLGKHGQAATLRKTLEEEGMTDRKLTQLAERSINFGAMSL